MAAVPSRTPSFPAPPDGVECSTSAASRQSHASDADTPADPTRGGPLAVLAPRDIDQITAVIRWANEHAIGLIPASSTGRRRRGDTVPSRERTATVDLSGMKKLVHVDARDKIAIIEPGIDFGGIDAMLQPHGLRAYRPLAPRAGKSVLASYLEREPLLAAHDHWDTGDPFGGTGVVLGNGRYAPSGGAAIEGTLAEHLKRGHRQMMPIGPVNLDILRVLQGAQGTLGVMAWAAVYCERLPVQEEAFFASADTLAPLVDLARDLLHRRLGGDLFIVDRVQLAMLLADDPAAFAALQGTLPAWCLYTTLSAGRHGTRDKMAWQRADLAQCAKIHGTTLAEAVGGRRAMDLAKRLRRAEPTHFRDRLRGAHRELFFLQQLDRAGSFVPRVQACLVDAGLGQAPLGVYLQPMTQGVNCHVEFTLPYDPRQAEETRRSRLAFAEAARQCAQAGAFFSRPYGAWSDIAFTRDTAIRPMLTITKSVFDPQGVMNPGRLPY